MGCYPVPELRLPLSVGSYCSPGYFWDAVWITVSCVQPVRRNLMVSPCPFWAKPITYVGLSDVTTIQA